MEINKEKSVKKWGPVIDSVFGYKNEYLKNTLCLFCEKYSINYLSSGALQTGSFNYLPHKLNEIKSKLDNTKTIPVVDSFYNPLTGLIEHKLENGVSIIENGDSFNIKNFDEKVFIDIFGDIGVEILREADPEEFRNNRLNSILSDEKEFKDK